METKDRKLSDGPEDTFNPESSENFDSNEESHQMTLNRPQSIPGTKLSSSSNQIEYHLTVQIPNSSLTQRDLSLLLDVLNFQSTYYGINFNMYLAMYELYFRLIGKNFNSTLISNEKIRLTVTVTETILKTLKGVEFSLSSDEFIHLPDKLRKILRKVLMSKRTYGSRYKTWRPEKFLTIRAVPVDIQFLSRKKDSQRYSGYTKGYGESHPSAHRQKLKPSAEYDGAEVEFGLAEEQQLFNRCTNPTHLLTEYLLIRYYNEIEAE